MSLLPICVVTLTSMPRKIRLNLAIDVKALKRQGLGLRVWGLGYYKDSKKGP